MRYKDFPVPPIAQGSQKAVYGVKTTYRNAPERLEGLECAFVHFRLEANHPPPDSPHRPGEDEDITTRTVTVAEARAMLERGEIIDLKTILGTWNSTTKIEVSIP